MYNKAVITRVYFNIWRDDLLLMLQIKNFWIVKLIKKY